MQTKQSIVQLLHHLWRHMSSTRRKQFGLLLLLMILTSFAEIVSIGAVIPFLGVLTAPSLIFEHHIAQPFIQFMGFTKPDQLLLPLTIAFGLSALIAGAMRLLFLWTSTRLSFATGADISLSIYRRTLYQPYAVHVNRNTSEIITGISKKSDGVITVLIMSLNLISSSVMLITILIALLSVNPIIALSAFCGFGIVYIFIIWLTRNRLILNSYHVAHESTQVTKSLQEGLGAIRDVLIDGSQATYCQIYRRADQPLRRAQASTSFIAGSPRFGMEAIGMLILAAVTYVLAQQPEGIVKAIPVLGVLALGAQRLLPVLQQAYQAWSNIQGARASVHDALELLDQPLPNNVDQNKINELVFQKKIKLKQLSFCYSPSTPYVINKLNLEIEKGARVGFIGATGSGKSTLLDIIMGLLQPTEGILEIDGNRITTANIRDWQSHIAHVPQAIFLADTTIEENIAFSVPKDQIDHVQVREAARQAQIADIIETWPNKYKTIVGERGVRLSGGQRQRIGIARALYKQADVIIFDEATSALDNETEQAVMEAIECLSMDLTILIIAHRLSTLKNCTKVVELDDGKIKRTGTYRDVVLNSG